MTPAHILVDIEALGIRPGAAIFQIGAVAFDPSDSTIITSFHRDVEPDPRAIADLETLQWHLEKQTWPRSPSVSGIQLETALADFSQWAKSLGTETFWAWGASYDFPHLEAAFASVGQSVPWRYSKCQCARTVWNVAFPSRKPTPKPHDAIEDARISALDLCQALKFISPNFDLCSGFSDS